MSARFLATVSNEMQAIAVGWQIYALTHRPLDLGLAGLAQFLPGVLLFLVSGHAADRFPRRSIVMFCYAGFAACSFALLALTLNHNRAVWLIYAALLEQRRSAIVQRRRRAMSFFPHSFPPSITQRGCVGAPRSSPRPPFSAPP